MCLVLPLSFKLFHCVVQNSSNIVLFWPWVSGVFVVLCKIYQTLSCFAFEFSSFLFICAKFLKPFLCHFQPKGADRKHKTDREKMDKRTEAEKVNCFVTKPKTEQILSIDMQISLGQMFFIFWINNYKMCHSNIFSNTFLLLGKIPAIIWMYSFDRGDIDFSLFFLCG